MAYTRPWCDDELAILKAHYPDEGPYWVGWESLLPDRTEQAIMRKANAIGLRSNTPKLGRAKRENRRLSVVQRDPIDLMVDEMMRGGMTPSEIDKRMHWYSGTAIRVITGFWRSGT